MKQKYILVSSLTVATLFAGCSDTIENLPGVPEENAGENYMTVEATAGGDDTRVTITDEISQFRYTWEDDDTFTVFSATDDGFGETLFAIDADQAGTNSASFTSTSTVSYTDGETLYALYNGNNDLQWENGNIILDISDQDGTLTDKYQYMFGKTTYDANGKNGFGFKHLVATLKVNMTLPEGISSISSVQLGSPYYSSNCMVSKATLVMNGAPFDSEGQFSTGDLVSNWDHRDYQDGTLTINNTFKADANNQVTVYFYVLPASHYGDNTNWSDNTYTYSTILVKDDAGNEYAGTIEYSSRTINRSDVLEMNTGLYQLEDFANESTVDGSQSQPYEIANVRQFYTFMFRNSHNFQNKQGYYYFTRSYYMTSDMELDNEMPWTPCRLFDYNSFDGQNHEISGNIRMAGALFESVSYHSNLKNIVFNANRTETNYRWGDQAIFVGSLYNYSTLEHCINKANIRANSLFPILAWFVEHNSTIIACGNEGEIVCGYDASSGLVQSLFNSQMIGCYNAGHYIGGSPDSCLSGLVYQMYNRSKVQSSWSGALTDFVYEPDTESGSDLVSVDLTFVKNEDQGPMDYAEPDEDGIFRITSSAGAADDWDTQFFIYLPEAIHAGQELEISFEYKTSKENGYINTMTYAEPGAYMHWEMCGQPMFSTEWMTHTWSGTVLVEQDGMQSIGLMLAIDKENDVTFEFKNIDVKVGKSVSCNTYGINYIDDNSTECANCYWNGKWAGSASMYNSGVYNNCGSFTDSNSPTKEQIDVMNADLIYRGYMFDATGRVLKSDKTVVKPTIIEKW